MAARLQTLCHRRASVIDSIPWSFANHRALSASRRWAEVSQAFSIEPSAGRSTTAGAEGAGCFESRTRKLVPYSSARAGISRCIKASIWAPEGSAPVA